MSEPAAIAAAANGSGAAWLHLVQLIIALSGVLALALTQSMLFERRRWASIVGLAGQPFWLTITFSWATWGMFLCSVLYTLVWCWSFYKHWLCPRERQVRL
jgi:hypothetical protein